MLAAALRATVLALAATTAFSQLDASPLHQLAFTSPSPPSNGPGELIKLSWADKDGLKRAVELFEAHDVDVWHAGRRTTPGRPPSESWEAIVRWPAQGEEHEGDSLNTAQQRLAAAGVPRPDSGALLPSLSERLSSPLISTSYSRFLSAASRTNLTASPSISSSSAALQSTSDPIHDTYHPYEGIYDVLTQLEQAYPEWVKVFSLGKSSEGRDIWAAKVTNLSSSAPEAEGGPPAEEEEDDDDNDDDDEPGFGPPPLVTLLKKRHKHKRTRKLGFVVAGTQHAREWIAASTTLYLMHDLLVVNGDGEGLDGFERSEKARAKLLNQVEFTFVPVVNPDGYYHSWDVDRLWRKSRQPVGKDCLGIDLNRNWGFKFQRGARPNPCSDSYPGSEPFESVELQALSNYLSPPSKKAKDDDSKLKIDAFLDVHSFGQMLLYPFSYSCDARTPDEENQAEAALQMSKALKDVHGRAFEAGSVCEVSLTSPGESLDWSYAVGKVRWSFGTELRDGGVFGFLLPPSQIRPSGEEMSAALRSLTQFILDKEAGKR
ncbi:hypothetical protein JCM6882_007765 [Rhodosporidiobolus microsporus]